MRRAAWATQNLAFSMRGQEKYEEAIGYYTQACTTLEHLNDIHHWSIARVNLGITYYYFGDSNSAIRCYLEAESIARQLHDRLRLADIALNLGLAYLAQGANDLAKESFQSSVQIFTALNLPGLVVNSMDGLAMCLIVTHEYDEALKVLSDAIALLPCIVNVPNYTYYQQSLSKHWQQAQERKELEFVSQADIA